MAEVKISELSVGDWVEIDGAATKEQSHPEIASRKYYGDDDSRPE